MSKFSARSGKFASVLSLMAISTVTLAGPGSVGSITYSSGLNSVPMLGGAGLVVLSALLALVSVKFLKNRENGGQFLVLALVVGAMASGGSGIKLISDAYARPAQIELGNSSGGTVNIPSQGVHEVLNTSGVTQSISQITTVPGCELISGPLRPAVNGGNGGSYQGDCSAKNSTTLQDDDYCTVEVCCGGNGGSNGGNNGGCFFPD